MKESIKTGVYVAIKVDTEDRNKVLGFCETELNIDLTNSSSPYANVKEGMHATLLAAKDSKNHNQTSVEKHLSINEFDATPDHWEIFQAQNSDKRILVLKLSCPAMKNFHEQLKKETGLQHSFNEFNLHISVHYDYKGEIPKELPDFKIKFKGVYTKPYVYNVEEKKQEIEKDVPEIKNIVSKITEKNNILNNINAFRKINAEKYQPQKYKI